MKIRTLLTVAAVTAVLALAVLPALAQRGPAAGPGYGAGQGHHGAQAGPAHGPGGQQGMRPQARPRAQAQGRQGPRGQGMRPRGFIEATPESKDLWRKLGNLRTKRHRAQWQMFELLSAEEMDVQALKNHRQKMVELRQQTRQVLRQLAQYRKPLPFARGGQQQGRGQMRGGARGGQGPGQQRAPRHGPHHGPAAQ